MSYDKRAEKALVGACGCRGLNGVKWWLVEVEANSYR